MALAFHYNILLAQLLALLVALGATPFASALPVGHDTGVHAKRADTFDVRSWIFTAPSDDWVVLDNGTAFHLVHIDTAADKDKRQTLQCTERIWEQQNIDRTGIKWEDWIPWGGCNYCQKSAAPCGKMVSVEKTAERSKSVGLDIGAASAAQDTINANAGLNLGWTWSESWSWSAELSCEAPPWGTSQLYVRQRFGCADISRRTVYSNPCAGDDKYGDWQFENAKWPLGEGGAAWEANTDSGCSTNENSGCQ